MKIAFIDFETDGLNPNVNHVIEGAVILMECDEEYNLGKVVDFYTDFNDPGEPLPDEITRITGITDDLVKSKKMNWNKFNSILDRADVIVAHNLKFDRQFLATNGKYRNGKIYACSLELIDWKTLHKQSCRKLSHLCLEHGINPMDAHRALDDVKLLIKLMKCKTIADPEQTYFQEMMKNIDRKKYLIEVYFAYDFDTKEYVKGLGFRWNGIKKCWYIETPDKDQKIKSLESKGLTKYQWKEED